MNAYLCCRVLQCRLHGVTDELGLALLLQPFVNGFRAMTPELQQTTKEYPKICQDGVSLLAYQVFISFLPVLNDNSIVSTYFSNNFHVSHCNKKSGGFLLFEI